MNDWWANKLAEVNGPRPSPVPLVPRGTVPLRFPQQQYQQPQYHQPSPQQQVAHQQQYPMEVDGRAMSYLDVAKQHDGEKITKYWKGGEAMRKEGGITCPNCGSQNIFQRDNVKVTNSSTGQRASARPRCFECGWTEDFMPGDAANWGG